MPTTPQQLAAAKAAAYYGNPGPARDLAKLEQGELEALKAGADLAERIEAATTGMEVAALFPESAVRPLRDYTGRELPGPVVWMDARHGGGTVLRVGDVAVLSGAGGVGKSFAALAIAVAAASPGDDSAHAAGFDVRRGGAVLIGYEDDPVTVAWRAGLIAGREDAAELPETLHLVPDPEPLMTADPSSPGKATKALEWDKLWADVAALAPSIVIVDPASAALAGVNQNDSGTVRGFVRALATEAAKGGFGVLLIAHSTKEARFGKTGPDRLAVAFEKGGAVAGSAQWWDACRGVLTMVSDGPGRALIQCQKANYGPHGWVVALGADTRERPGEPDLFAGWIRHDLFSSDLWEAEERRRRKEAQE